MTSLLTLSVTDADKTPLLVGVFSAALVGGVLVGGVFTKAGGRLINLRISYPLIPSENAVKISIENTKLLYYLSKFVPAR